MSTLDLTPYHSLLIFGGSFDPPHRAHLELPCVVANQLGCDVIVYVPAGRAPHKLDQEQTDPAHRLAMLRLALAGREDAVVLSDEVERVSDDRPSYTVDTLQRLRERISPDATMRLLIGADQVRIFDSWHQPERVVALAEPAVMVRPPDTRESLLASLDGDADRALWAPRLVEVPQLEISSTEIRGSVAAGESIDAWVCAEVERYISEHGLYAR